MREMLGIVLKSGEIHLEIFSLPKVGAEKLYIPFE